MYIYIYLKIRYIGDNVIQLKGNIAYNNIKLYMNTTGDIIGEDRNCIRWNIESNEYIFRDAISIVFNFNLDIKMF